MDDVETRKELVKKAIKIGIKEDLLQNLTSLSIKKILEHDKQVKEDKHGFREIPGYRA